MNYRRKKINGVLEEIESDLAKLDTVLAEINGFTDKSVDSADLLLRELGEVLEVEKVSTSSLRERFKKLKTKMQPVLEREHGK